jgi:hypothetical protein
MLVQRRQEHWPMPRRASHVTNSSIMAPRIFMPHHFDCLSQNVPIFRGLVAHPGSILIQFGTNRGGALVNCLYAIVQTASEFPYVAAKRVTQLPKHLEGRLLKSSQVVGEFLPQRPRLLVVPLPGPV